MTPPQERALANLGRALAAIDAAGLVICGVDDQLVAYPAKAFDRIRAASGSYEARAELDAEARTINDHGAYRDSGST